MSFKQAHESRKKPCGDSNFRPLSYEKESNPFSPLTYGVRKGGRPTDRPLRHGRTGGRRGGGHPLERKLNRDVGEKGESETRVRPEGRGGSFVVLVPLRSPSSVCRSLDGWWCPCDAEKGREKDLPGIFFLAHWSSSKVGGSHVIQPRPEKRKGEGDI